RFTRSYRGAMASNIVRTACTFSSPVGRASRSVRAMVGWYGPGPSMPKWPDLASPRPAGRSLGGTMRRLHGGCREPRAGRVRSEGHAETHPDPHPALGG